MLSPYKNGRVGLSKPPRRLATSSLFSSNANLVINIELGNLLRVYSSNIEII